MMDWKKMTPTTVFHSESCYLLAHPFVYEINGEIIFDDWDFVSIEYDSSYDVWMGGSQAYSVKALREHFAFYIEIKEPEINPKDVKMFKVDHKSD